MLTSCGIFRRRRSLRSFRPCAALSGTARGFGPRRRTRFGGFPLPPPRARTGEYRRGERRPRAATARPPRRCPAPRPRPLANRTPQPNPSPGSLPNTLPMIVPSFIMMTGDRSSRTQCQELRKLGKYFRIAELGACRALELRVVPSEAWALGSPKGAGLAGVNSRPCGGRSATQHREENAGA